MFTVPLISDLKYTDLNKRIVAMSKAKYNYTFPLGSQVSKLPDDVGLHYYEEAAKFCTYLSAYGLHYGGTNLQYC